MEINENIPLILETPIKNFEDEMPWAQMQSEISGSDDQNHTVNGQDLSLSMTFSPSKKGTNQPFSQQLHQEHNFISGQQLSIESIDIFVNMFSESKLADLKWYDLQCQKDFYQTEMNLLISNQLQMVSSFEECELQNQKLLSTIQDMTAQINSLKQEKLKENSFNFTNLRNKQPKQIKFSKNPPILRKNKYKCESFRLESHSNSNTPQKNKSIKSPKTPVTSPFSNEFIHEDNFINLSKQYELEQNEYLRQQLFLQIQKNINYEKQIKKYQEEKAASKDQKLSFSFSKNCIGFLEGLTEPKKSEKSNEKQQLINLIGVEKPRDQINDQFKRMKEQYQILKIEYDELEEDLIEKISEIEKYKKIVMEMKSISEKLRVIDQLKSDNKIKSLTINQLEKKIQILEENQINPTKVDDYMSSVKNSNNRYQEQKEERNECLKCLQLCKKLDQMKRHVKLQKQKIHNFYSVLHSTINLQKERREEWSEYVSRIETNEREEQIQ